ncbi:MAG TPA: SpoIIE family protein phosphatase, partial [Rectinemataceae bacterium]|nr:SpoIIE family protein phosphatase [Rectinemataceae bacterium]
IVESLGTRLAASSVLLAKARILGRIDQEVALARSLADSPVVRAWVLDEASAPKEARARAELESYRRHFADGSYFVAIASSGTYYNQGREGARSVVGLSEQRPSDAWFWTTLKIVREVKLNLDFNPYVRQTKVWINCVMREGERPIAVAGSGIDISDLVQSLTAEASNGFSLMLLDAAGNITAHRETGVLERNARAWSGSKTKAIDLAGSARDRLALSGLLEGLASRPEDIHSARLGFEGSTRLVTASYLPGIDWIILAGVDLDRVLSLRNFAAIPAAFIVALVLSLIAVAGLVDRLVLRPLAALDAAAARIAAGHYELALPAKAPGELGRLSFSFARMAHAVRESTEDLELQVAHRTEALAEANARMLEDLRYADLVQRSILPEPEALRRGLPRHFVIFRPRDRVGGDFYFFAESRGGFFVGVIDCTGHGVSGALMTMFSRSALELIAARTEASDPAAMVRALDEHLRAGLAEGAEGLGAERGLDIGLCRLEPRSNRLLFAGAGIDLFVVEKGESPRLERVRTGHGSIGSAGRLRAAAPRGVEYPLAGRTFILSSDGFFDQAGGPKGFGFGSTRFAELALSCSNCDMAERRSRFEAALAEWQGELAQRDDITVLAFEAGPSEGA